MTRAGTAKGGGRRRSGLDPSSWGDPGAWLVAFATAIGLWTFVNYGERPDARTVQVRLEPVGLAEGLIVTNPSAEYADIRVAGPGPILSGLDGRRIRAEIDLAGAAPGRITARLAPRMFNLPRKLEIVQISPPQARYTVEKLISRTVPVTLERRGDPPGGRVVADVEIVPASVRVVGPASRVEPLSAVFTESLDAALFTDDASPIEVGLVPPAAQVRLEPKAVVVRANLQVRSTERRLEGVPVAVRGPGRWVVEPAEVAIAVRGPDRTVRGLALEPGSVYVDGSSLVSPGPTRVRPTVQLPEGVALIGQWPAEVVVRAAPGARAEGAAREGDRRE